MLGFAAFVAGVVALFLRSRGSGNVVGAVALLLAIGALGIGVAGTMLGRMHTFAAVSAPGLDASQKEKVLAYGIAESNYSAMAGALAAVPGGGLGLLAIVLALTRKPPTS